MFRIRKALGVALPVEVLITSYWGPSKLWTDYVMGAIRSMLVPEKGVCVCAGGGAGRTVIATDSEKGFLVF